MTPTTEQNLILESARETDRNLIVEARAGAAKTTTLLMLASALPSTMIRCVAFNKKIATELQERLPGNAQAATFNSLGHRALGRFLGRKLRLDTSKTYKLLQEEIGALRQTDQKTAYKSMSTILNAVRESKSMGFAPSLSYANSLVTEEEFLLSTSEKLTPLEESLTLRVCTLGMKSMLAGTIDFDDQILGSATLPATFDPFPLTMVDEAQDLSPVNHQMLRKMCKRGRLIAVGDPCQAIYGFRGASETSMDELRSEFKMQTFYLTGTFRCAPEIVEEATWRAPDMTSLANHPGSVTHLNEWTPTLIPDDAAIICRNNAPLLRVAFALIRSGRYPEIVGNDVLKGLSKVIEKLGPRDRPVSQVEDKLQAWYDSRLKKTRAKRTLEDQLHCLKIILNQGSTIGEALTYLEHITKSRGHIKLTTAHKSKGLEFDNVYLLDKHLMRDEGQDLNLLYVAQTRAKVNLTYIDTEGLVETPDV